VSVTALVVLMQVLLGLWNTPPSGLAEAARREAFRRANTAASIRRVTNADLMVPPERDPPVAVADTPAAISPPIEPETNEESETKDEAPKDEEWWRARMTLAREAVARGEVLVAALDSRVAALTTDVVNRDDPAQRARLVEDHRRAVAERDRMRDQLAADVQTIDDIMEEARKGGVPPGWLREK
jgi:hypothetical protein